MLTVVTSGGPAMTVAGSGPKASCSDSPSSSSLSSVALIVNDWTVSVLSKLRLGGTPE